VNTVEGEMCVYTDWFLAEEREAEALGKADLPFQDWPCLSMKGIIGSDLTILWGLIRNEPESRDDVAGEPLFSDVEEDGSEGMVVSRVIPGLIDALAILDKIGIDRVARQWHQSEDLAEWEAADVVFVLREMVEFAQRARRAGKPVLELSTW
jgi:hypothetical protein